MGYANHLQTFIQLLTRKINYDKTFLTGYKADQDDDSKETDSKPSSFKTGTNTLEIHLHLIDSGEE